MHNRQPICRRHETIYRESQGRDATLTVEEKELLVKAARLMEQLIETLEVAEDRELVHDVDQALREVSEGRTRPLPELIKELGLEDQVQA